MALGSELRDQPLTQVYMATAAEKRERALAAIQREIVRAMSGITGEELERVKVSYLADLNRRDRTTTSRTRRQAEWWSQGLLADRRGHLERVIEGASVADVNRVVADVLDSQVYYFAEAGAVPE